MSPVSVEQYPVAACVTELWSLFTGAVSLLLLLSQLLLSGIAACYDVRRGGVLFTSRGGLPGQMPRSPDFHPRRFPTAASSHRCLPYRCFAAVTSSHRCLPFRCCSVFSSLLLLGCTDKELRTTCSTEPKVFWEQFPIVIPGIHDPCTSLILAECSQTLILPLPLPSFFYLAAVFLLPFYFFIAAAIVIAKVY